jgi:hypothetical protein
MAQMSLLTVSSEHDNDDHLGIVGYRDERSGRMPSGRRNNNINIHTMKLQVRFSFFILIQNISIKAMPETYPKKSQRLSICVLCVIA